MIYDPHVWLVWSHEYSAWWRPNSAGYTTDVLQAGRYTLEEATDCCESRSYEKGKPPPEEMVHVDSALKGAHGILGYAQARAWVDELDPLLSVPPTIKTPAQQYREIKDWGETIRAELLALRHAAAEAANWMANASVGTETLPLDEAERRLRDALAAQVPSEPVNGTGWKS
jgi:hypothetical protein